MTGRSTAFAGVFASQMFPASDATASLVASFSVFAVGFIGCPIGAFVLSLLADKHGRRTMLSATIIMAGLGSLVIAACPTYAQIGILASLVIVAARLLQGFSAGGEYQIAVTFLNEHAGSHNRAFAASPQQLSIGLLSPGDLESWDVLVAPTRPTRLSGEGRSAGQRLRPPSPPIRGLAPQLSNTPQMR